MHLLTTAHHNHLCSLLKVVMVVVVPGPLPLGKPSRKAHIQNTWERRGRKEVEKKSSCATHSLRSLYSPAHREIIECVSSAGDGAPHHLSQVYSN